MLLFASQLLINVVMSKFTMALVVDALTEQCTTMVVVSSRLCEGEWL